MLTRLSLTQSFSLDLTLGCGQVFRWWRSGEWWEGVVRDRFIRIRQDGQTLTFTGADRAFVRDYFQLDLDLDGVITGISRDDLIRLASERCRGLRIVKQPPWECLVSYITATNTNIPRIRDCLSRLAERFGDELLGAGGRRYHAFPDPGSLAAAEPLALRDSRLGYRADYISATAQVLAADPSWEERLDSMTYEAARRDLISLRGIGPKAADCILLFAFGKYESFPVDVWIRKIMYRHYRHYLGRPPAGSMTPAEYEKIRSFARGYFGQYAGYAQEYLFCDRDTITSTA